MRDSKMQLVVGISMVIQISQQIIDYDDLIDWYTGDTK